jgi:hypothetical protein
MGLKKILKKVKKAVTKVAKPAALIGAAYLASKGLKGKGKGIDTGLTKGKFLMSEAAGGARLPKGKFLMSEAAGGARLPKPFKKPDMRDIAGSGSTMPSHLTKNLYSPKAKGGPVSRGFASGGRTGYSAGGAAKRGVSPILLKGKR